MHDATMRRSTTATRPRRALAALLALALTSVGAVVPGGAAGAAPPDGCGTRSRAVGSTGALRDVVDQIGARELWCQGVTGESVTVAVIDTGVVPVPALSEAGKVATVVDLSREATVPDVAFLDTYGHGTHMAGIIAGRDPGADPAARRVGPGFLGVAPDAHLVSVKVADHTGAVDVSQVIAGLDWVVEHKDLLGVRVLNLSYGTDSTQGYQVDPLAHAVERAWRAGIVVVVAAGNDGRGTSRLANPALDPFVIAVAAAQSRDGGFVVPSWVTSGDGTRNPDVSAPGVSVEGLRAPGSRIDVEHPDARVGVDRFLGSGSSQAAAVTSGAVALLLDARPGLTPDEVKAILRQTAVPFQNGHERFQGRGLISLPRALAAPAGASATQTAVPSSGSGSLEASRGSAHVDFDGTVLIGEVTAHGATWGPWHGPRWSGVPVPGVVNRDGVVWSGFSLRASSWRGVPWRVGSWTAEDWQGASWREGSWSGASWRGASWRGSNWSGVGWR